MKQSPKGPLDEWLGRVDPGVVLQALADSRPDAAVFAVDADRRVVLWSEGAQRLLGFTPEEALGEHCLKTNRCQQCMVGCGISDHGDVADAPLTLIRADGDPVRVRKTGRAFFDEQGRFAGGVEILEPDTRAPAEEAASAASAAARAAAGAVTFHGLASTDPAMHQVFDTCRNVAETDVTVLVRGDSGTGKELLARALHAESARADGPFVAVNCAALSATLLESELFGHVKGAFTGAAQDRKGIFRQAHGGTLFLDEVAELPLDLQSKLLRVLEEREVTPVGGGRAIPVDVRIVAATHQSLRRLVATGRFRQDLMFRLRVVPIHLPPLRDRRGDVALLLWRFVARRNAGGRRVVDAVAPDAMRALLDHPWPGNVRELKNVVDYAFAVGRGPVLRPDQLPPELRAAPPSAPSGASGGSQSEAQRIRAAIDAAGGHLGRAAEALGMSRPTLWRKRKRYGL